MSEPRIDMIRKFIWEHHKWLKSKPATSLASKIDYAGIDYDKMHPLYGTCHRASCWYLFLINGEKGPDGPIQIWQQRMEGVIGYHTYCLDSRSGDIIDVTADQLPEGWEYKPERKASTITTYKRWGKTYPVQTPSNFALKLAEFWKEKTGSAEGLQYWLDQRDNMEIEQNGQYRIII